MKKTIFIISTFSFLLFFSCENQKENGTENTKVDSTVHSENQEHNEHLKDDNEALTHNNGEKWEINEEMDPHVSTQEDILKKYKDSKSSDYKTLAKQLTEQNTSLINSCTMEGESHEELHKWLHPHMELLEELGKSENNDQAEEVISKLEKSFQTFHQYFQ